MAQTDIVKNTSKTSQLNVVALTANYGFDVASGRHLDISHVHKFGAVPAMSQNQTGTIWDVDDTPYPWSAWATAGSVSVPAVAAGDNGVSLIIEGLDANYMPQTETLTLSDTGAVPSTKSFIRLFRAYTAAPNTGAVTITKSGNTVAKIQAGKAQTLMSIYTIPANYTGYLLQGSASCQAGADATGNMYVRYFGQTSFRVGHSFEFSGAGGQYLYKFPVPIKIPAKSDIDIQATVRSNNARITAAFDLLLHDASKTSGS